MVATKSGAAVLFVDNVGGAQGYLTNLLNLGPGPKVDVDTVPVLYPDTSADVLVFDEVLGIPTVFAGDMPGIWRVFPTTTDWRAQDPLDGTPYLTALAGKMIGGKVFLVYTDLTVTRLATAAPGVCWQTVELPRSADFLTGLDVDSREHAWISWFGNDGGSNVANLWSSDGTQQRVWTGIGGSDGSGGTDGLVGAGPHVLSGGLAGTAAWPALALQTERGIHIVLADSGEAPHWTDQVLPGSKLVAQVSTCPGALFPCPTGGTCMTATKGTLPGTGFTRTSSAHSFVAWLSTDGQTTYGVPDGGYITGQGNEPSSCGPPISQSGNATVVIGRLDGATPAEFIARLGAMPAEVLRIQINVGHEISNSTASRERLALATRGDTLLVVVSTGMDKTELYYFEIDATQVP
jgi:hypothetical protein